SGHSGGGHPRWRPGRADRGHGGDSCRQAESGALRGSPSAAMRSAIQCSAWPSGRVHPRLGPCKPPPPPRQADRRRDSRRGSLRPAPGIEHRPFREPVHDSRQLGAAGDHPAPQLHPAGRPRNPPPGAPKPDRRFGPDHRSRRTRRRPAPGRRDRRASRIRWRLRPASVQSALPMRLTRRYRVDTNAPVTSWDFIKENYRPHDRIAIVVRNRREDYTLQRLLSAQDAASPRIQRFLRYENAHGADIYVSMNTLKPGAKGRTKADIAEIRHLYLDLDEDGDERLARVLKS